MDNGRLGNEFVVLVDVFRILIVRMHFCNGFRFRHDYHHVVVSSRDPSSMRYPSSLRLMTLNPSLLICGELDYL